MAEVHILNDGYLSEEDDHVRSTVGFVRDAGSLIVIDPGMVASPVDILDPLEGLGAQPADITDVVLSHHHPDHTLKAALFPNARVHDHWAWYRDDLWTSRPAEGFRVSPAVALIETPGHTPQDISTLVETDEGLVVFTHLWWMASGPEEDPYAQNPELLHRNRERVLALPGLTRIVPGHGPAFDPGPGTPR
ncbi:MAG: MBL fold metallo-hydrolase [Actinomycetota bacterium]|nr:MBL fold metallo-hydrolase [Actinomycetota bacterium]